MTDLASKISAVADKIDEFRDDHATRIGEIEKRFARMGEGDNDNYASGESFAATLVNSADFKRFNGGANRETVKVQSAAITSANPTVGDQPGQGKFPANGRCQRSDWRR